MLASGSLNVMIERVAYRPLRNAPKLAPLITAIGMCFILQNVGLLWRPTPDARARPDRLAEATTSRSSTSTIEHSDVFAVVVTVPLLSRCSGSSAARKYGKAMRATAQDPDAARLMGINVDRTISLTFLLGGLLAGAAGLIYALYNGTIQFNQGFTAGLIAFTAAVMGGIGNLKGAVVGGLIIGVIQSISDDPLRPGLDPRRRVRDPDPGHGLPAAGPVRRGDARRMSGAVAAAGRSRSRPRRSRRAGLLAAAGPGWPDLRSALAIALPVHPRPADRRRRTTCSTRRSRRSATSSWRWA